MSQFVWSAAAAAAVLGPLITLLTDRTRLRGCGVPGAARARYNHQNNYENNNNKRLPVVGSNRHVFRVYILQTG